MDEKRLTYMIETSFLSPLLQDKDITDISYNGEKIFYLHNLKGRCFYDFDISNKYVFDFIRTIANISEKPFSYSNPILDISIGKYRLNAVHPSIGRVGSMASITFSIRISSDVLKIHDGTNFLNPQLIELFLTLLENNLSIVIAGETGCGKTEFQKYLITKLKKNSRVIIIDNILELDRIRRNLKIDINSWQYDETRSDRTIKELIKNALRSNPDWLIVSEARGEEMEDVLISVETGHPIITTLHSYDLKSIPLRMARMVMMGDKRSDYKEILNDINYHFKVFVFLTRDYQNDSVERKIKEIGININGEIQSIYLDENNVKTYQKLPKTFQKSLKVNKNYTKFNKYFMEVKDE